MTTNGITKAVKGVLVGVAMMSATVFQAGGCTMGADSITSMTSLLSTALEGSDVAFSFSSSPSGSASATTGNRGSYEDFGNFGFCDCGWGF